jgi:hypothetical protein
MEFEQTVGTWKEISEEGLVGRVLAREGAGWVNDEMNGTATGRCDRVNGGEKQKGKRADSMMGKGALGRHKERLIKGEQGFKINRRGEVGIGMAWRGNCCVAHAYRRVRGSTEGCESSWEVLSDWRAS